MVVSGKGRQSAVPGGKGRQSAVPGGKGRQSAVPGGKGRHSSVPGGKGRQSAVPGGKGRHSSVPGGKGRHSAVPGRERCRSGGCRPHTPYRMNTAAPAGRPGGGPEPGSWGYPGSGCHYLPEKTKYNAAVPGGNEQGSPEMSDCMHDTPPPRPYRHKLVHDQNFDEPVLRYTGYAAVFRA